MVCSLYTAVHGQTIARLIKSTGVKCLMRNISRVRTRLYRKSLRPVLATLVLGSVASACVVASETERQQPDELTATVSQPLEGVDPCGEDAYEGQRRASCTYSATPSTVSIIHAVDLLDDVQQEPDGKFSCTVMFVCDWSPSDEEPAKCDSGVPSGTVSPNEPPKDPNKPSCGKIEHDSNVKLEYRFATRAEAEKSCEDYVNLYGKTAGGQLVVSNYCEDQIKKVNSIQPDTSMLIFPVRIMTEGPEYSNSGLHYYSSTNQVVTERRVETLCCFPKSTPASAPAPAGTSW